MSDREFLVEANVQDVLKYIITENKLPIMDAMRQFYASEVFKKLQDYETGLYLESPGYIYEMYRNEVMNNGLVQDEI
ncbi:MAG: hypothetical protein MSA09_09010 [Lachnospiraceae bacterium]|nr:hypothetical protein [Lachnospiraceae bacterium]MCI7617832.1 hypothetical protein [Bacillota bacterium]